MRIELAKEHLREKFLEKRRELTFETAWALSAIIQRTLVESPLFRDATKVALYSSIQNEVLTDEIFTRGRLEDKNFCYPRVHRGSQELSFVPLCSLDELSPGAYDIREPGAAAETLSPSELDLIILPGVAFDTKGARLGFGKGYYDRALTGVKCPLVALAYDFQITDSIPTEDFDVTMEYIITEERIIRA